MLALPLADLGFDTSVLCEFRARLVAGGAEHLLFDAVLEIARARHLVRPGGRQRSDATHVLAAVRSLNRLACVVEVMRHALSVLAVAAPAWLAACVDRAACAGPDADRRLMTLRTQGEYEALAGARRRQQTPDFAALYAWRAGVEATMSWPVRGFGLRRARYVGLGEVRLQHVATAAALNLVRLTRWITGLPIASTRASPFFDLLQQPAML